MNKRITNFLREQAVQTIVGILGVIGAIIIGIVTLNYNGSSSPATITASIPTPATPIAVALRDLDIRSGPGSNFDRLNILPVDTSLDVIGISEDRLWYQVLLRDGTLGWISASEQNIRLEGATNILPIPTITSSNTPRNTTTPTLIPTLISATPEYTYGNGLRISPVPQWSGVVYSVTISLWGYTGNANTTNVNCGGINFNASIQQSITLNVGPFAPGQHVISCVSEDGGRDTFSINFIILQNADQDGDGWFDNGPDNQRDLCPYLYGSNQGCPDNLPDSITTTLYPPSLLTEDSNTSFNDNDRDGIPDSEDYCPDEAGPISTNGCWQEYRNNAISQTNICSLLALIYARTNIRETPEIANNNIVDIFLPTELPVVLGQSRSKKLM